MHVETSMQQLSYFVNPFAGDDNLKAEEPKTAEAEVSAFIDFSVSSLISKKYRMPVQLLLLLQFQISPFCSLLCSIDERTGFHARTM